MCVTPSQVKLSICLPETSVPAAAQVSAFALLCPASPCSLGTGLHFFCALWLVLEFARRREAGRSTFPCWHSATLRHPSATRESPSSALPMFSAPLTRAVSCSYSPCGPAQGASFLNSHPDSFNPLPLTCSVQSCPLSHGGGALSNMPFNPRTLQNLASREVRWPLQGPQPASGRARFLSQSVSLTTKLCFIFHCPPHSEQVSLCNKTL